MAIRTWAAIGDDLMQMAGETEVPVLTGKLINAAEAAWRLAGVEFDPIGEVIVEAAVPGEHLDEWGDPLEGHEHLVAA